MDRSSLVPAIGSEDYRPPRSVENLRAWRHSVYLRNMIWVEALLTIILSLVIGQLAIWPLVLASGFFLWRYGSGVAAHVIDRKYRRQYQELVSGLAERREAQERKLRQQTYGVLNDPPDPEWAKRQRVIELSCGDFDKAAAPPQVLRIERARAAWMQIDRKGAVITFPQATTNPDTGEVERGLALFMSATNDYQLKSYQPEVRFLPEAADDPTAWVRRFL
jgi:hypothetical protein